MLLNLCVVFTGHEVRFTFFKLVILCVSPPPSFFWTFYFREIICLIVSSCKHAFKAFGRILLIGETTMIMISWIIPNVWSALWRHGPQEIPKPIRIKLIKERPPPITLWRSYFLKLTDHCLTIFYSGGSTCPEVSIHMPHVVSAIA